MSIELYTVTFIASFVLLLLLLLIGSRQNISYYVLAFLVMAKANMGYYYTATADSLDVALLANKLVYVGAVFTPLLVNICYMKICKIKIPKCILLAVFAMGMAVLTFVFTVENNGYYYKSVDLEKIDGVSYLVKEYGSMHSLFYVYLAVCMIVSIYIIVQSLSKRNEVSYRTLNLLLLMEMITIFGYSLKHILSLDFEITPVAYIADEIIILVLLRRINMYDISENIAKALEEHSNYGYVVFDKFMRYVGCNEMAKVYFPELCQIKVDRKLGKNENSLLYKCFSECMSDPDDISDDCNHIVENDGTILKCTVKDLHYGNRKKKIGYMIEIVDDTQQQKYLQLLNNYNSDLAEEVRRKSERINSFQDKLILSMADMVENRDNNTGGHIKRTSKAIKIFVDEIQKFRSELNIQMSFLENVVKAAPMHDLGKIAVDDSILRKPGKFTPEEFDEMKKHSEKGAVIVGQLLEGMDDKEFVQIASNVANYHHEKWNGQGYPKKLKEEEIPVEARIMALADVFDALVSKRCYKEKMDYDQAFSIIEESSGSHFDPRLTEIFMNCREELESFYNTVED